MIEKQSWWSQRTSLEKTLTVVCVIGCLLSIGLLVGLIVVAVQGSDHCSDDDHEIETEDVHVCLTKECIEESSLILKNMNLDADPCDDFYEFACGSFLTSTRIPDEKTTVTAFSVIDDELKNNLRDLVEEPIDDEEIEPFKNVKKLFHSCMDKNTIESRGQSPITPIILEKWPLFAGGSWSSDNWNLTGAVVESKNAGYSASYFFSFSVSTDNKNSAIRAIRIDQASLGLSRQYLINGTLEQPFVAAYHSYQKDIAALLFGDSEPNAAIEMEMLQVLDFEFKLANISMPAEDRRDADKIYNPLTVEEIQTRWNIAGLNWLTYFNSLLPVEAQLESDDRIIVGDIEFFNQIGELLENTPKRTLANYIGWRQIASSIAYLPKKFTDRRQEYVRATTGQEVSDPIWLECVQVALNFYPHSYGAMYVRKHFKDEAKDQVLELVKNIKDEFKIMLEENTWMDDDTKKEAEEKANKMAEQMAYADELKDDEKLIEFYNTWPATVDVEQYYESIFKLNKASTDRSWKRLREPVDKDEWTAFVTPAIVNAFYSSIENTIKFPAGILNGAFFNPDRPQYMNYGGIGFVIGHEITHGFDDQGSQYDADGNLRNWWADDSRQAYKERAECIINQYGNYTEPLTGLNVRGINTQGENIADNGGIKESYRAYVRWAEEHHEPQLPGLDFSPRQMFWVSAGQIWCSLYRRESMINRIQTGVHSPGQFRVVGPMSNLKAFSDDFGCSANDKMNPASKCEVW